MFTKGGWRNRNNKNHKKCETYFNFPKIIFVGTQRDKKEERFTEK